MVMFKIQIKGATQTNEYLRNVQRRIPFEGARLRHKISDNLWISIFNRAPVDTGFLRRNITIRKGKDEDVVNISGSAYLLPQEYGFTPHLIPVQYIEMHKGSPGARFPKGGEPGLGPFVWVSRAPRRGFIKDSIKKVVNDLNREASQTAKRIVKK